MNKQNQRHVVRDGNQWKVVAPHAKRASAILPTQERAVDRARQILRGGGGGELLVHSRGGQIRKRDTVPPAHDPFPPPG